MNSITSHFEDKRPRQHLRRDRPLRIYLADLAYFNRLTRHVLHVPKNIGYIASYAKKMFGNEVDIRLFKNPDVLLAAMASEAPDVIGFSFYFWNTYLNRAVTAIARERYARNVTIIWGGASVDTDEAEQKRLFQRFPDVDAFVPNEG